MFSSIMYAFKHGVQIDIIVSNAAAKPADAPVDQIYGNGWKLEELVVPFLRYYEEYEFAKKSEKDFRKFYEVKNVNYGIENIGRKAGKWGELALAVFKSAEYQKPEVSWVLLGGLCYYVGLGLLRYSFWTLSWLSFV